MVNLFVHDVLRHRKLKLVGWSSRGFDMVWTDPIKIFKRIWRDVFPGAIILLHEGTHPPGKLPVNPQCLELLLEQLKLSGYAAVIPNPEQLAETRTA
jgi:peptidoglycan/xylan/chitin deacetylase (PgdA/CDA1 family)